MEGEISPCNGTMTVSPFWIVSGDFASAEKSGTDIRATIVPTIAHFLRCFLVILGRSITAS
jgi:hypothetical protein